MASIQAQLAAELLNVKSLPVSPSWLNDFLSSSTTSQRNIPLSALTRTALFRLLASDFRTSLSSQNPSSLLPVDIFNPTVQERRLQGPIPLQVLDIEDIGSSIWSQVEAIERVERGEAIRGREIVRTVNVDEASEERATGTNNRAANPATNGLGGNSTGPHRLVLQDAAGTRAVAVELKRIEAIGVGKLPIGAKLLVHNAIVARGIILLTPESVSILGGKLDSMDQAWREGRKTQLMARITEMERSQES